MKNKIRTALLLFGAISMGACNKKNPETAADTAFCLSDTMQQKITIDPVISETVKNSIALSGKIGADEDKWVKVYPVVGGVVETLKAELGDYVTKGQVLAVIHSSEIADYQSQLSFALSNLKIQEKSLKDIKDMQATGLATEKEVIAAETEVEKAKAELNRIRETNAIFRSKGNALQTITAPVSGYIIEKNVTDQMQFKADGALPFFTIANLDEVWVMANVFESDIARIKTGYDAEVKVLAYGNKVFTGKIDRIFPILDPQSRVMKVRIRIPNKDNLLKPEMFAQISISYEDGGNRLLAIPARAVIFDKNRNYVMVYKDKCHIEAREIEIYQSIGNTTYIKSGLQEGEKIITRNQLLVYDALND